MIIVGDHSDFSDFPLVRGEKSFRVRLHSEKFSERRLTTHRLAARRVRRNRGIKGCFPISSKEVVPPPPFFATLNRYAPRRVVSIDSGVWVGEEVAGRIECTVDGIDSAGN